MILRFLFADLPATDNLRCAVCLRNWCLRWSGGSQFAHAFSAGMSITRYLDAEVAEPAAILRMWISCQRRADDSRLSTESKPRVCDVACVMPMVMLYSGI